MPVVVSSPFTNPIIPENIQCAHAASRSPSRPSEKSANNIILVMQEPTLTATLFRYPPLHSDFIEVRKNWPNGESVTLILCPDESRKLAAELNAINLELDKETL